MGTTAVLVEGFLVVGHTAFKQRPGPQLDGCDGQDVSIQDSRSDILFIMECFGVMILLDLQVQQILKEHRFPQQIGGSPTIAIFISGKIIIMKKKDMGDLGFFSSSQTLFFFRPCGPPGGAKSNDVKETSER